MQSKNNLKIFLVILVIFVFSSFSDAENQNTMKHLNQKHTVTWKCRNCGVVGCTLSSNAWKCGVTGEYCTGCACWCLG